MTHYCSLGATETGILPMDRASGRLSSWLTVGQRVVPDRHYRRSAVPMETVSTDSSPQASSNSAPTAVVTTKPPGQGCFHIQILFGLC